MVFDWIRVAGGDLTVLGAFSTRRWVPDTTCSEAGVLGGQQCGGVGQNL